MAVFGQFVVTNYTIADGVWKVELVNGNPGAGNVSHYYVEFALDELGNMNQNQLAAALKERLGWTINATYGPLNTAIANGMTITLP